MSPRIFNCPWSSPRRREDSDDTGSIRAIGVPRRVIITGSRVVFTLRKIAMHFALNSEISIFSTVMIMTRSNDQVNYNHYVCTGALRCSVIDKTRQKPTVSAALPDRVSPGSSYVTVIRSKPASDPTV